MNSAALFIDLDGTLYDSVEIDAENKVAAINAIADFRGISFYDAKITFDAAHAKSQRSTAGILNDLGIPDSVVKSYQLKMVKPELHLTEDFVIRELLEKLRCRYKIVLFTNTRHEIAVRALAVLMPGSSPFDLIVGGGDMFMPKPSVKSLTDALKEVGCDPKKSFTVGDRWAVDHAPGQMLGMNAVEVKGRNALVEWMKKMVADCG